jgi:2-amino-4-hydroxy-6-hydroxymethyldihydropteridine diphosphokinase
MDRPVVLGLGSNKGDSLGIILEAITALDHILDKLKRASLYESDPLYVTNQNRFINTAAAGLYPGAPGELLAAVQEIEARFGRDRSREQRWGERPLDIDILLFGDLILNERGLQIPHPRLKERRFALEPLLELMPCALEPGTGIPYQSICDALPAQGVKRVSAR